MVRVNPCPDDEFNPRRRPWPEALYYGYGDSTLLRILGADMPGSVISGKLCVCLFVHVQRTRGGGGALGNSSLQRSSER